MLYHFVFFIFNDVSSIQLSDLITGYWSGYGWSGQYFFIILFQLIVIFPIIRLISAQSKKCICFFFLLYALLTIALAYLFWSISFVNIIPDRFIIYWIPYAPLGILLFKSKSCLYVPSGGYVLFFAVILIPFEFELLKTLKIVHST